MKKPLNARASLLQRFLASDISDLVMGTCLALAMGLMINAASAQPIPVPRDNVAIAATMQGTAKAPIKRKSTALPIKPRLEREFIRAEHQKLRPTAGDVEGLIPTF